MTSVLPAAPASPIGNEELLHRIRDWLANDQDDYDPARVYTGPAAAVLADSVNADTGDRLTTVSSRMALIVWAEMLTHKDASRNSGSSRAVPVLKRIWSVIEDPFVPDRFPMHGKGMQPDSFTEPGTDQHETGVRLHLRLRRQTIAICLDMLQAGFGKEIVNRYLYAWLWNDSVISATDWSTIFKLRCHPDAQRQIRQAVELMRDARSASTPRELERGQWHLPLVGFPGDEELSPEDRIKVGIGRVARTSYLTHLGARDPQADLDLYNRVRGPGHLSPFEHAAHAEPGRWANYTGFKQARWYIEQGLEPGSATAGAR